MSPVTPLPFLDLVDTESEVVGIDSYQTFQLWAHEMKNAGHGLNVVVKIRVSAPKKPDV